MTNEDDSTKASLETSLDEDELTIDELTRFFEELQKQYESSKVQNKKLRKENELLKNKLDIIFKEKEDLSISFEKAKKDFDSHQRVCKSKIPEIVFDKSEFESLKNKMNVLYVNLKKNVF